MHSIDHGGAGPSVVLLHGGGRSAHDWDTVAPALVARGHRVIAVDLPSGGTPSAPWTWPAVLDGLDGVVERHALGRPAMVGHSLGGMVAALWTAERAGCPLAVNLDGHGNPTSPARTPGADHAPLREFLDEGMRALDPAMREIMVAIAGLDLPATYRRARGRLVLACARRSMAGFLPTAAQPAWRAYEHWVVATLERIAAEHPGVTVIRPDTGHDVHREDPEGVVELVSDLLRSPRVEEVSWGRMVVAGLGTGKDFKLWPGGGRAWDWAETGTGHSPGIQPADVEELIAHGATTVVLSRGMEERLEVQPATLRHLAAHGIAVEVAGTVEAVARYNALAADSPVAGLFHSTC